MSNQASDTIQRHSTDRMKALEEWFGRVNAKCLWSQKGPNRSVLEGMLIAGHFVILQIHAGGSGWEMYIPASNLNSTSATIYAVAKHCGVEGYFGPLPA